MSTAPAIPEATSHPWSEEALYSKALLYIEQMHSFSHADWRFVLWSTLAMELLVRAAISNVSPALLADSKDTSNTLFALGHTPKAPKFIPKSSDITTLIRLLGEVVPNFTPDLVGFGLTHMLRRNEELHSGGSPLMGLPTSQWLPSFYRFCQLLLVPMGESLDSFLDKSLAHSAQQMIQASLDESAKAVAQSISTHAATWNAKQADEKNTLIAQAKTWATKQNGHRVSCPSCQSNALVLGTAIAPPIRTIDGDEITEVQQYLPTKFECIACGLKITGLPQLNAAGLGDAYNATSVYDATEYYAPEEDRYAGYEPDFND